MCYILQENLLNKIVITRRELAGFVLAKRDFIPVNKKMR